MNKMQMTDSERLRLLDYLKNTYRYDAGGIVNRRTGRRPKCLLTNRGYYIIDVRYKGQRVHLYVHRTVWALCHGAWPVEEIDHINGDRQDNRVENLRQVSRSENMLNWLLPWRPNKVTGVTGVVKHRNMFLVSLRGRQTPFHDPYEAFYWAVACGKKYRSD